MLKIFPDRGAIAGFRGSGFPAFPSFHSGLDGVSKPDQIALKTHKATRFCKSINVCLTTESTFLKFRDFPKKAWNESQNHKFGFPAKSDHNKSLLPKQKLA